jgi:protoporphyrinogen oxidase
MNLILGAGLAGLSASYHLGHENCLLLEKQPAPFGHVRSMFRDGFVWDEGPHVSFTKQTYVQQLFSDSVRGEFDEYEVRTGNYYEGHWIEHPAQTHLHQIPEPLRSECLDSFLKSRDEAAANTVPKDYGEWLRLAFGEKFSKTFPEVYTRKYWTLPAAGLTTKWVGSRVFYPSVDDVVRGAEGPLGRSSHYITRVRYPRTGGFQSFAQGLAAHAVVRPSQVVDWVDLKAGTVGTTAGAIHRFDRLINTLPLPLFVESCRQATPAVKEAAKALACSEVLLVNVTAPHEARRPENWLYVYDEDKFSTRINFTERLTSGNAKPGWTGIQVEVYFSRFKRSELSDEEIGRKVVGELVSMGLIDAVLEGSPLVGFHTHRIDWANVIFDHEREAALATIFDWLGSHGLVRECDDLDPGTDWEDGMSRDIGRIVLAGRFGQWKYFWTDDCVLRGKLIADSVKRL